MGGYATLHFGLAHPERALSLVVAGCGYGSVAGDRERFQRDADATAQRFLSEPMERLADFYCQGPTRVQFRDKDPLGWQEFRDQFAGQSALGHGLTMRGVQVRRPSVYALEAELERLTVPTLVVTGDEDDPCLEPGIFLKRKIRASGLVVIPKAGHTINLEEPEAFNRAVLDFLTAVEAGRWTARNPASQTGSAILPAEPARARRK
jgi:pimeloyl-ACP methyl ester carboxylesterase